MNRIDPALQAHKAALCLREDHVATWDGEALVLASRIARAPLVLIGGLASTRLTFSLSAPASASLACVPITLGDNPADLHFSSDALDALAGLLEPGEPSHGAGQTLSLDALEALVAALLAPLGGRVVGYACWREDTINSICALHLGEVPMPVSGTAAQLDAFAKALGQKAERLVAAPLSYFGQPQPRRYALSVENLVGTVTLNQNDCSRLEAGGAVLPDVLWPAGLTVAARRFVANDDAAAWVVDPNIAKASHVLRAAHREIGLDALLQGLALDRDASGVTLVDQTGAVAAKGRLAQIDQNGQSTIAFVIDATG